MSCEEAKRILKMHIEGKEVAAVEVREAINHIRRCRSLECSQPRHGLDLITSEYPVGLLIDEEHLSCGAC